jgi:CrcB protein
MFPMTVWLWVMAGGAVGAAARYGVTLGLAPLVGRAGPPLTGALLPLLLINVLGSFLLGLTLSLVGRGVWPEAARLAFGTGVLGAFTTFSAFSVELDTLFARGQSSSAVVYVVLSVGLGVGAAAVGRMLGARA